MLKKWLEQLEKEAERFRAEIEEGLKEQEKKQEELRDKFAQKSEKFEKEIAQGAEELIGNLSKAIDPLVKSFKDIIRDATSTGSEEKKETFNESAGAKAKEGQAANAAGTGTNATGTTGANANAAAQSPTPSQNDFFRPAAPHEDELTPSNVPKASEESSVKWAKEGLSAVYPGAPHNTKATAPNAGDHPSGAAGTAGSEKLGADDGQVLRRLDELSQMDDVLSIAIQNADKSRSEHPAEEPWKVWQTLQDKLNKMGESLNRSEAASRPEVKAKATPTPVPEAEPLKKEQKSESNAHQGTSKQDFAQSEKSEESQQEEASFAANDFFFFDEKFDFKEWLKTEFGFELGRLAGQVMQSLDQLGEKLDRKAAKFDQWFEDFETEVKRGFDQGSKEQRSTQEGHQGQDEKSSK